MHALTEPARTSIRGWSSDAPGDLAVAVAWLCREILDVGSLPEVRRLATVATVVRYQTRSVDRINNRGLERAMLGMTSEQAIAAEWRIRSVLKAKLFGRHRLNRNVTLLCEWKGIQTGSHDASFQVIEGLT